MRIHEMHWKVRSRSAAPSCSPDQTPAMRRASSAASSSSRVRVRVRPTASRGSLDRETKRPAGAAVVRGASVTRSQPTRCHIGASPTAPMSQRVGTGRHGPGRAGPGRRAGKRSLLRHWVPRAGRGPGQLRRAVVGRHGRHQLRSGGLVRFTIRPCGEPQLREH